MSGRRALVLITTSYPIRGDGSEAAGSFVSDLAGELACHVPVRVVAPGTRAGHETWAQGVEVFRFAAPEQPLSTLKPWKLSELAAIRRVLEAGEEATRQAVQSGPTAHILALWALPSGHWARRVARASGVPYSVWTLGSDIWTLGRIPLVRTYLRRVLLDAQACYSDGLKLAEDTRRLGGREVRFLPSTRRIDCTRPDPPKGAPPYRLLFLGRWHTNKGVDLLLDALAKLNDEDWQLIEQVEIHGGGPLETLVHDRVATLRMVGRPISVGRYLNKGEAEAAIVRTDWVLIPSRIESIPVIFSDAMKLGRPVISMPVGDLSTLVGSNSCGTLADRCDARAFTQAIQAALATDPCAFSEAVARNSSRFDLRAIARSLLRETTGRG